MGLNQWGNQAMSGMYIIKLQTGTQTQAIRVITG